MYCSVRVYFQCFEHSVCMIIIYHIIIDVKLFMQTLNKAKTYRFILVKTIFTSVYTLVLLLLLLFIVKWTIARARICVISIYVNDILFAQLFFWHYIRKVYNTHKPSLHNRNVHLIFQWCLQNGCNPFR